MIKWFAALLVCAGLGWLAYSKWPQIAAAAQLSKEAPARVSTAVAEIKNIRFNVSAAGEISPAEQVSVKPEINGRIDTLPVDLGDKVKKGDVLFTLDDKELQNQRASSVTEVERAKLQLQQAERNYKRAQQLRAEKLISEEVYENARTEFELSRNTLERSQREIATLEERLTKTKISAPFDCTILTRPVSMGQAVSGSGGFNSGTEVLTIADLNSMIINAHINQADISRLKVQEQVEVTIEAVSGLKITGSVERIAPQATIRNNIKGFAVRILLKDVDQRVRPGMTANIQIPVASVDNVVSVPLAAVFTERNPDNGKTERYVFIKKGESFERRNVQVGVSDYFNAEIQSGLASGDEVSLEQPKEDREKPVKSKQAGNARSTASGLAAPKTVAAKG